MWGRVNEEIFSAARNGHIYGLMMKMKHLKNGSRSEKITRRPCRTPDGSSHSELAPASCICPALYSRTNAYPDSDTHQSLCSPRPLPPGCVDAQSEVRTLAGLG